MAEAQIDRSGMKVDLFARAIRWKRVRITFCYNSSCLPWLQVRPVSKKALRIHVDGDPGVPADLGAAGHPAA